MRTVEVLKELNQEDPLSVIEAVDDPAAGKANVRYDLYCREGTYSHKVGTLTFRRHGPVPGPGLPPPTLPGLTNEALVAVVIDRLRGFQRAGESFENKTALVYLQLALEWMKTRSDLKKKENGK